MVHTDFALRRPVTTLMAFAAVAVIGIVSSRLLPLEQYPDVSFPFMGAGVPYPGSTPEETEELITRPIEDALATLPGIEEIRSTSSDQDARFEIRFAWGTDINTAGFEVRNKLDSVRSQLPKTADRMWMWMASTADSPMLTVRFSADSDLSSQYDLLDRYFKKPIERLDGVARVELAGVGAREVRILVDPGRLAAHAVDIRQLVQLLEKSNFSVGAGQITGYGERLSVRPLGEFRSLDEIRNLVIRNNVRVGDIASVELVSPEITRRRHLDGRPAVGLDVFKSTQANVVEVVDRVLEVIERNKDLPQMQGISVFLIDNQAEAIRTSLSDLTEAGLIGGALAFAVLFLFLRHPTKLYSSLRYNFGSPGQSRDACDCNPRTAGKRNNRIQYPNSLGGQLYVINRPRGPQAALSAFYMRRLGNALALKTTYTVDKFSSTNIGLGLNLQAGSVNFYVMADNLLAFRNVADSHYQSFQFGLNIISWGKN
jgi:HAE1 family hydrophobic/amphiphilic exporter-1